MAVKKQHYVWRGYLKRWDENMDRKGRVYVYRKNVLGDQPEMEYAPLEKVGFQNYFYDMGEFSENDEKVVSQLIKYIQRDDLVSWELIPELLEGVNGKRDFVETLMGKYENIDNKHHFLDKINSKDLAFYEDYQVQKVLNELMDEMLNSPYDNRKKSDGELIEDCLNVLKHRGDEDLKYEFHRFFFMQHLRNPIFHEEQVKSIETIKSQYAAIKDINTKFYVNSLMLFFVEIIAFNVSKKMHTWIERYENKTDVPFVTTDVPVVNLTGTKFLEKNEFYYPVSPKIAIKLCVTSKESKYGKAQNICLDMTDKNEVKKLNLLIAKKCYKEVYANNKEILENIKLELQSL